MTNDTRRANRRTQQQTEHLSHAPAMSSQPYTAATVCRVSSNGMIQDTDSLAEESAVALVYNGISHAVLMATPQNLEELALGFSLSEGILQNRSELYGTDIRSSCDGIEVRLDIASSRFQTLKERRRSLNGRTGCGLCGIDSLSAVKPVLPQITRSRRFTVSEIQTALSALNRYQPLRQTVGSLHGAAWADEHGIAAAFEDVGRHNALDKLIGHGTLNAFDWQQGFAIISSRASYEMVAKAAVSRIGCIVAVSAPTALAVRLAEQAGMTLIGFAGPEKFTIYTHAEFIEAV